MDMRLEVVVLPVSDADRSIKFFTALGWRFDGDFHLGPIRAAQVTPPGSRCSIVFGEGVTTASPGSTKGLLLVVSDLVAARKALIDRGAIVSDLFHRADDGKQLPGLDPQRKSYASFATFSDPDGNTFLLQEITRRLPGREDGQPPRQ